ncbi:Predicted amidohydrolase [Paracoccus halophilus]|uniref:Predicted amidohydrolase n=1 Tax=Paracoccus halophilus TaxID=376733 RepID=A0A1I0SRW1_9RHOB|nr:Predicted amidohydrolase [Paracoccus halophilus]
MLLCQAITLGAILLLSRLDPVAEAVRFFPILMTMSLSSATQDIAADGWAAEHLPAGQHAFGNAVQAGALAFGVLIVGRTRRAMPAIPFLPGQTVSFASLRPDAQIVEIGLHYSGAALSASASAFLSTSDEGTVTQQEERIWGGEAALVYAAGRDKTGQPELEEMVTVNAYGSYPLDGGALQFGVTNLLGRQQENSTATSVRENPLNGDAIRVADQGRRVYLGYGWSFWQARPAATGHNGFFGKPVHLLQIMPCRPGCRVRGPTDDDNRGCGNAGRRYAGGNADRLTLPGREVVERLIAARPEAVRTGRRGRMTPFAITGVQMWVNAVQPNIEGMLQRIDILMARFPWTQMVLFSELAAFGPLTRHALPLTNEHIERFQAAARRHHIWLLPGSMFERCPDGRIYNTATVINPLGEIVTTYRKMFPFRPYEAGVEAGTEFCVFDVPGIGRFGLSICYDIWFPETTRQLTSQGVEVLLHPVLTGTTDRDAELAIARATAAQFQCYIFDVNGLGAGGNGRSCVVDPSAQVLHQSTGQEDMFPIEVDLDQVRRQRLNGLKGLGQVLKSFRDRAVDFPVYDRSSGTDAYLQSLGPLAMPRQGAVFTGDHSFRDTYLDATRDHGVQPSFKGSEGSAVPQGVTSPGD